MLCDKYNLGYKSFKKKKGLDVAVYRNIFKALKAEHPDVIMMHGTAFLIPVLLYKLTRPGVRIYGRDTQAANLKTKKEWVFLTLSYLISNKTIFLTAEARAAFASKVFFLSGKRSGIIPNGVNMDLYARSGKHREGNTILIGMQSRLQLIKDHSTLIKAFGKVVQRFPQYQLKLQIAGEGSTKPAIEQLISQLGLNETVTLAGNLKEDQLIKFMAQLDIYVHATFGETLSNSILQAMSMGLPIIASDVWGVNNLIEDTQTGLLYRSADTDDLVDKISMLILSESSAVKLGETAHQKVVGFYSSDIMANSYEKLFLSRTF